MKKPARILVVDDNRANRLISRKGLESQGYEVDEAEDGDAALAKLAATLGRGTEEERAIDLVVLDVMMPGMDGTEVLREIRACRSRIELPVIMATAKDGVDDVVEALEGGANDYIVKPVKLPVLAARVGTQLELRAAHLAVRTAHQSLVRSAKMETAGFLAAGVAHEIRNPLARIKMGLGSLLRNDAVTGDEKLSEIVGIMKSSLATADKVVQNVMKLARDTRLDLVKTEVNPLVEEVLSMIGAAAAEEGVGIDGEFDPGLPDALVARTELTQALLQLFNNAIDAMAETGGTLTVRTSSRTMPEVPDAEGSRSGNRIREGDTVVAIEILDTGPGLPVEDREKLFDPFFTTHATGVGVGMGLTVARKLVELHGGLLMLRDRKGDQGACATVLLRKASAFLTSS